MQYMALPHSVRKSEVSVVFFISELFLTSYCITISLKGSSINSVSKYNYFFGQTVVPTHNNCNYIITPIHSIKGEKDIIEKKKSWSTLKSHLNFQFTSDYMKKSRPV